ncbi:RnfH family protein [Ottowia thiooxydans]|uniref:RnfH family protein n=1 Tax=Ottowia thiooxydans TaxID=219182 RepID=UPI00040B1D82|nr:RnfH family protein [Ottowia thiooxydans]
MNAKVLSVTVIYAPAPRQLWETVLTLPLGSTVQDAIDASGWRARFPEAVLEPSGAGVWGRKAPLDQPLQDDDRVEIWRGLTVDPKVARRERFSKQGARGAGLFAQRRAGAKSGY